MIVEDVAVGDRIVVPPGWDGAGDLAGVSTISRGALTTVFRVDLLGGPLRGEHRTLTLFNDVDITVDVVGGAA